MTKIDIVSDEEARKMLRENAENRKKLDHIHLKGFDFSSAERALETVPVTNRMYDRLQLQEQLRKEKEEKKKKLEEQRLAHLAQKDIDDGLDF